VQAGPLGAVVAMAVDVWKDTGKAAAWLMRPHPLLDGQPPLRVAPTEDGARRVMDILGRLQHGTAA
jgi:putative toxin-antitoxin system antitoxin component (TIGR02293 family)